MLSEVSRTPAAPALRPSVACRASVEGGEPADSDEGEPVEKRLGGLVLARQLGESIMIGDEVEVQVAEIKSGAVRLRIVAPRSISVHRREVFDEIQANPVLGKGRPESPEPKVARPGKSPGGLVLSRTIRQSIMIGDEVEVMVVEVRPSSIKLKISAPRSVAVHRREVFDAIRDGLV